MQHDPISGREGQAGALNNLAQHLCDELDRQTRTFWALKELISTPAVARQQNSMIEKHRLLQLIRSHSKDLARLQQAWLAKGHQLASERHTGIREKIAALRELVIEILAMERRENRTPRG